MALPKRRSKRYDIKKYPFGKTRGKAHAEMLWTSGAVSPLGDYGMFSDAGNKRVHSLVQKTKKALPGGNLWERWKYIRPHLDRLHQDRRFAEVGDTEVTDNITHHLWPSKQAYINYFTRYGFVHLEEKPEDF